MVSVRLQIITTESDLTNIFTAVVKAGLARLPALPARAARNPTNTTASASNSEKISLTVAAITLTASSMML